MRKLNISLCVLVNGQLVNVVSISKYFTIFNSKFRRFCQRNGVLSLPSQKKGKSVSHKMKEEIVSFYEDDEISRIMPGKKDYFSIGRYIHKQKRLLLANLKELHSIFNSKYPARQIRFSRCVLAGSYGTHSVCVCTHHQNMKPILVLLGVSHTELYEFLVCDSNSKECMIHRCSTFPENTKMVESKL